MVRGMANRAKACMLMTNKNSANSSEQDFKNILIALAVKREVFVDNQHCKDETKLNIPICM